MCIITFFNSTVCFQTVSFLWSKVLWTSTFSCVLQLKIVWSLGTFSWLICQMWTQIWMFLCGKQQERKTDTVYLDGFLSQCLMNFQRYLDNCTSFSKGKCKILLLTLPVTRTWRFKNHVITSDLSNVGDFYLSTNIILKNYCS